MKIKNEILLIGLAITLAISIFNLNSISSIKDELSNKNDSNKTFIPPAPKNEKISTKLNNTQKNMLNNPMTPQMNNNSGRTTIMSFNEDLHDFGKVDIETENKHSFVFKNNGKEPLQISNAKGSCGCTVPEWPKDAIMPGQNGEIVVIYRPNKGQAGSQQNKTVTVTANTEPANTILNIKASVNPVSE